jgi:hypothetical protein
LASKTVINCRPLYDLLADAVRRAFTEIRKLEGRDQRHEQVIDRLVIRCDALEARCARLERGGAPSRPLTLVPSVESVQYDERDHRDVVIPGVRERLSKKIDEMLAV